MRFPAIVVTLILSCVAAFAADVSGDWNVTVDTPNGPLPATLTLKQDGEKLTGSVNSQMGESPIAGTAKENDLQFTMTMDANGMKMVIKYVAKVDGDKIAGSLDLGDQGQMKFSGTKKN